MSLTDEKNLTEDVVDINIDGIKRTKFRINGDNDAIIELNLSDLGILQRLEEGMKKLSEEMSAIANISNDDEDLSEKMKQADQKMREYVDYIFDYPVSAACVKYGTMYDPKDGVFRYEAIINTLTNLYANNINAEFQKLQKRITKYTDKYTAPAKVGKGKKR